MKTLTMDGLQVYMDKNEIRVSVAPTMTNKPNLSELENLKSAGDRFLPVQEIVKNNSYTIKYELLKGYKTLLSVKNAHEVLKLSLLNEILKMNTINQDTIYTPLIHPANIYFADMKTVRYMYTDNGELYSRKTPILEQYKALIISMLTRYSFEKMQDSGIRKGILQKSGNLFLIQIEKCKAMEELMELVENRFNKMESEHFMNGYLQEQQRKKKNDKKLTVIMGCTIAVTIVLIICLLMGL